MTKRMMDKLRQYQHEKGLIKQGELITVRKGNYTQAWMLAKVDNIYVSYLSNEEDDELYEEISISVTFIDGMSQFLADINYVSVNDFTV